MTLEKQLRNWKDDENAAELNVKKVQSIELVT